MRCPRTKVGATITPNRRAYPILSPSLSLSLSLYLPSALLIRVLRVVSFAHCNLALLLGRDVFNPDLLSVFFLKIPNVARVPQLRGDAQVLAAAHQRVGLAPFAGGGDTVVVTEELALATGLCDESGIK